MFSVPSPLKHILRTSAFRNLIKMKVSCVFAVASIALMVDYAVAYGLLDGLSLLQNYYGVQPAATPVPAPVLPPAPAPLPAYDPMAYALALSSPLVPSVAVPPPPPAVSLPSCPPAETKPACSCGHPSCLSMLKPCIHAKLLNLKKKLIEKKLAHLLACCAQYNSHMASHSC